MKKAIGSLFATSILVIGIRAHADPSATPQRARSSAPRGSIQAKHVRGSSESGKRSRLEPLTSTASARPQILLKSADRDRDGRVSYLEFATAARDSIARRAKTRLRQIDRNRDGRCTHSEVNKMSSARFARFDLDHDGSFSEAELATVMLRELDARLDRVYAILDRDHDAYFSIAELTPPSKQAEPRLAQQQNPERKRSGRKAGELARRGAPTVY